MIIGRLHTRRPVYTHEWSLCDYGMQTSESGYEQPDHGSIYSVESTTGSKNMANCRMHRNSTNQFHRIKLIEWSSNAQPSACPTEGTHVRQRTWKASKGDFLSRKLSSRRIHSKRLPNRRLTSRRLPMLSVLENVLWIIWIFKLTAWLPGLVGVYYWRIFGEISVNLVNLVDSNSSRKDLKKFLLGLKQIL